MCGEWNKHRMGLAIGIAGAFEVFVKAGEGPADSADCFLRVVLGSASVLPLKLRDGFQVPWGLSFDRLGCVIIIEDGFEFSLFGQEIAQAGGIIETQAALLQARVTGHARCFARGGIDYFGQAKVLAVNARNFGSEIQRVNRPIRRICQQPGDVKNALLVL